MGRLAGGIAHDFNNVLTVIQTYAEVLAFELHAREVSRKEVDAIRAAAYRASALARQLLAFSRREVIRGMELILRRMITTNITLALNLAADPLVLRVDAGQLEEVLMNLTINAEDAMPHGGTLNIAARAEPTRDGESARVLIEITDTGTGMSDEVKERLFEPIFTTKPVGRGTGLDLATTYAIVIEAGGRIAVESVAGNVSCSRSRDITARNSSSSPRTSPPSDRRSRASCTRTAIACSGRRLAARRFGAALRRGALEPGRIDLLVTDVMMPGIGGE